jgi:hypothetical protein
MKIRRVVIALVLGTGLAVPLLTPAQADIPGRHPAYLHALDQLRDARWFLEHRPGPPLEERERQAIFEIDRAIEEVRRAAYYDGKDVYRHPREDEYPGGRERYRRISELLRMARDDVAREEDNVQVRDMQFRAVGHIDNAIRAAESVMVERERQREWEREHDRDREYDRH